MNTGLWHLFKNFSIFFKKTLKFLKTLSLPILDAQETVHREVRAAGKKNSKIFASNPKVLQKAAVTGLDVAKKSRLVALFFDLKGMFFETCIPQETYAARA